MVFGGSHFGYLGHPCWDVGFPSCLSWVWLEQVETLLPDFHSVPCEITFPVLALPFPWGRRWEKRVLTSGTALLLERSNNMRHLANIPSPVLPFSSWIPLLLWCCVELIVCGELAFRRCCLLPGKKDVTPLHCRDDNFLSQFYWSREQLCYRDAFIFSLSAFYIPFNLLVGLSLPVGKGAGPGFQCHISLRDVLGNVDLIGMELYSWQSSLQTSLVDVLCASPTAELSQERTVVSSVGFYFSYANCVCQLQNPTHWENTGNGKFSLLSMSFVFPYKKATANISVLFGFRILFCGVERVRMCTQGCSYIIFKGKTNNLVGLDVKPLAWDRVWEYINHCSFCRKQGVIPKEVTSLHPPESCVEWL